jgi:hypothetical protein
MKTSLLSVKGRHFDGHSNGSAFSQQYQISDKKDTNSERRKSIEPANDIALTTTNDNNSITQTTNETIPIKKKYDNITNDKYWMTPQQSTGIDDVVVIHVCDENRHISKDFCCKRDVLVKSMKYFENFLAENENGYDDIDISVHCDVEIFEWLMNYIHTPDNPPQLEKSILVSILISSEFLQMDQLVDHCLQHISENLNDITKLPIDLSCISEKLVNKLAAMTSPKTLSATKDRKDKILNKLYKRRVELDFSRKSNVRGGVNMKTIASSLTCCKYCGTVYLENYVASLTCPNSPPSIEFRGRLSRKHAAIPAWSLTSYLKALHAGGMTWEYIYWHVWSACVVFSVSNTIISARETDRYNIESDGLCMIKSQIPKDESSPTNKSSKDPTAIFDLSAEDESRVQYSKLFVTKFVDSSPLYSHITPTLNPNRPLEVLSQEIFELIGSQMKYIAAVQHADLIKNTFKNAMASVRVSEDPMAFDYGDILWAEIDSNFANADAEESRGRSRSPGRSGKEPRKQTLSLPGKVGNPNEGTGVDAEQVDTNVPTGERRSRSSSTGKRRKNSLTSRRIKREDNSIDRNLDLRNTLMLKSLPTDILKLNINKGPIKDYWLITQPIQTHPMAEIDTINMIQETNLSDGKKIEWELDVLREYDEKRMERFESFLVSKRNSNVDYQLKPRISQKYPSITPRYIKVITNKFNTSNYYKDRGRQPRL